MKLSKLFNSVTWKKGYNPELIFVSPNISDMCEKSVWDPIPRTQHGHLCVTVNLVIVPQAITSRIISTADPLDLSCWSRHVSNVEVEQRRRDPNDTTYKRWSCHSGYKLLCNGARFTVFWQVGHVDTLDGWHCSSLKRVMSRQIQVRQHHTNESGFTIYTINKYMLGSR